MKGLLCTLVLVIALAHAQKQKTVQMTSWTPSTTYPDVTGIYPGDMVSWTWSGTHNVNIWPDTVTSADCSQLSSATLESSTSPYTYEATTSDSGKTRYFACSINSGGHCDSGMHIGVQVMSTTEQITWATSGTAMVDLSMAKGDSLLFDFSGTNHVVKKFPDVTAYDNCDFSSATDICTGAGPCTYLFSSSDGGHTHYFGCDKNSGAHCTTGNMKVAVVVSSASAVASSVASLFLVFAVYFTNKRF